MSDLTQYLTLGLDQELFGIDIQHVHEILDMRPISALPQAPDFLLGMIDVRGTGYPVVDLRLKLGLASVPPTPLTRIIILNVPVSGRRIEVGFVADRVYEVTTIDDGRLDPAPGVGGRWRSDYIAGIGRKGERFVVIFDLEKLMTHEASWPAPLSALAGSGGLMPSLAYPAAEALSDRQFQSIVELIQGQVGIQLPPVKRTMVEGRLRKRVRLLGLRTLEDYGRYLFQAGNIHSELVHLIDCVTTNKTDFFREPTHFDFLISQAVPALLRNRGPAPLKIWSSACSIGAEAYTVAMVLEDMRRGQSSFDYAILGTDICSEVLETARTAVYSDAMLEPVPSAMRQRYVMTSLNATRQQARIVPELRRRTQFSRLNLMDPQYPFDRDVDVIFCRNVLIYFDKPTQKAVVEKLSAHLRPGGYLILGHSESMVGSGDAGLRQVLPTIFQA